MRLHRCAAIAALVVFAVLAASCGQDSSYCQALNGTPSILCPNGPGAGSGSGGSSGGMLNCLLPTTSLWECNVVGGPNALPLPVNHTMHPGNCGSLYCASSVQDAETQSGAAGDSSLSCVEYAVTTPTWASCITWCNPCSDGQGGTLQNVGEYCNTGEGMAPVPGGSQCCAGLTCSSADTLAGICQGTLAPCPQAQPNWVGLDTGTLRNICINNNVNGSASQSGVALNRTCGVAFETWCLKTMGWLPRWTTLIESPRRQTQNANKGGLPGSVIPEQVRDQSSFMTWVEFPQSLFVEVKAVNGTLTLGTSQYQILGLLNVAQIAPAPDAGMHAPPAVFFITTSNTAISQTPQQVVPTATGWGVAVWQQIVYYDANGGTNPNLSLGNPTNPNPKCLNGSVYGSVSSYPIWPGSGPQNPLTWATDQEQDVVGAVAEPPPDSPALVP